MFRKCGNRDFCVPEKLLLQVVDFQWFGKAKKYKALILK